RRWRAGGRGGAWGGGGGGRRGGVGGGWVRRGGRARRGRCAGARWRSGPSGKPTAGPDVPISVFGNVRNNSSYTGFRASAIAFPSVSARYPHPSSTVNTIGFGRFVIAQKNTRPSRDLSQIGRASCRESG